MGVDGTLFATHENAWNSPGEWTVIILPDLWTFSKNTIRDLAVYKGLASEMIYGRLWGTRKISVLPMYKAPCLLSGRYIQGWERVDNTRGDQAPGILRTVGHDSRNKRTPTTCSTREYIGVLQLLLLMMQRLLLWLLQVLLFPMLLLLSRKYHGYCCCYDWENGAVDIAAVVVATTATYAEFDSSFRHAYQIFLLHAFYRLLPSKHRRISVSGQQAGHKIR